MPTGANNLSLRDVFRVVRHFAAWADYHAGGGTAPSRRPARLTYYAPYRSVADDSAGPRRDDPAMLSLANTFR